MAKLEDFISRYRLQATAAAQAAGILRNYNREWDLLALAKSLPDTFDETLPSGLIQPSANSDITPAEFAAAVEVVKILDEALSANDSAGWKALLRLAQ